MKGSIVSDYTKDTLAQHLGISVDQLDKVTTEYHMEQLSDEVTQEQAQGLRDKLSQACLAFYLADASQGNVPPHRPSWVQPPGNPARKFPEL